MDKVKAKVLFVKFFQMGLVFGLIAHFSATNSQLFNNELTAVFVVVVSMILLVLMSINLDYKIIGDNWLAIIIVVGGLGFSMMIFNYVMMYYLQLSAYWESFLASIITMLAWKISWVALKNDVLTVEKK